MAAREQRHEQQIDDRFVADDDAPDLGPEAAASLRRALEEESVTADDWGKGCQGFAFVLQACPMREAGPIPLPSSELPPGRDGVVERPPPGMARGVFVVSPPVVALLTGALLLLALGHYALRLPRAFRR
jgi:hypothetical protein